VKLTDIIEVEELPGRPANFVRLAPGVQINSTRPASLTGHGGSGNGLLQATVEIASSEIVASPVGIRCLMNVLAGSIATARCYTAEWGASLSGVTGNIEGLYIAPPAAAGGAGFLGVNVGNYTGGSSFSAAFYTTMASGAGRRSVRCAGTAPMTVAGAASFGVDSTPASGATLRVDAGRVDLQAIAVVTNPSAGYVGLYVNIADGQLYAVDSAGTAEALTSTLLDTTP